MKCFLLTLLPTPLILHLMLEYQYAHEVKQHKPADIPKLISSILKGEADMVNGSRYLNSREKDTPAYRCIGQTVLDKVTVLNSGIKITDSQSGFRAFSAPIVNIFRFNTQGMAIESEMLADAGRYGLRVKEVPIGVKYDVDGSTENPVRHGLTVLLKIIKVWNIISLCVTLPCLVLSLRL